MQVRFVNRSSVWASAVLVIFAALPCAASSPTFVQLNNSSVTRSMAVSGVLAHVNPSPEPDTTGLLLCAFGLAAVATGLARRSRTRSR